MFKLSAITSTILMVLSSSQNAVAFTTPTRFNTAKATIQSTRTSTTARNMIDMEPTQFTSILDTLSSNMLLADIPVAPPEGFEPSYSKASYYTILGLYIMSFPGIWSQIKRSTKAKVKRKTYVSDGEATEGGKDLRQQAGEIMAYMKANNYEVVEAGEVITFQGLVKRSASQAYFLVFCTLLGMASLALVLQIQFADLVLPVIGKPNWFYLCLISPYAGIYYWQAGDRVDDFKVKLESNEDETLNEVTMEGNDEELDRMWRALELKEKGMVKVEGLLG